MTPDRQPCPACGMTWETCQEWASLGPLGEPPHPPYICCSGCRHDVQRDPKPAPNAEACEYYHDGPSCLTMACKPCRAYWMDLMGRAAASHDVRPDTPDLAAQSAVQNPRKVRSLAALPDPATLALGRALVLRYADGDRDVLDADMDDARTILATDWTPAERAALAAAIVGGECLSEFQRGYTRGMFDATRPDHAPDPLAAARARIEAIEHPCHEACVPHHGPGDGYSIHADCQCAAWMRQEALAAVEEADRG